MAADAIGKIANTFIQMSRSDLVRIVVVTAVTGVCLQVVGMAGLAAAPTAVVQWKIMRLIKLRRRPGLCIVADRTVGGE